MDIISEFGTLLAGFFVSFMVQKICTALFNKFSGQRVATPRITVTSDSRSIRRARTVARKVPNWAWPILTWAVFVGGYVSVALSSWTNTAMCVARMAAIHYFSPAQQLMLKVAAYVLTPVQACWLCWKDYQAFSVSEGEASQLTWDNFKRAVLLNSLGKINTMKAPKTNGGPGYLGQLDLRPAQSQVW